MSFALVRSRALRGLQSPAVTVEVHLANGLPSFTLVGLADTEAKESRERVRAALQTSGLAAGLAAFEFAGELSLGGQLRPVHGAVLRYQGKISGPLLDRIDIQIEVPAVDAKQLAGGADGEASVVVAGRVRLARERALERQGHPNAELAGEALDRHCGLDEAGPGFLQRVTTRLGWSARSFHRVLRVARTVADLEGHAALTTSHLGEAIQCRRALGAAG